MKTILNGLIIIIVSSIISTLCALYLSDNNNSLFKRYDPPEVNNQHEDVIESLKKSAIAGNIESQFTLGTIYYLGRQVPKDDVASRFWFNNAYSNGSLEAQVNLASMYQYGEGGNKDLKKALSLYADAAQKGSPVAFYSLGKMYLTGDVLEKNERYGLSLLQDSCTAGYGKSCLLLRQLAHANPATQQ